MEYFLFWLLFAIVVGIIASSRGRSGVGWWFLAMIISPLLGIILVALLPSVKGGSTSKPITDSSTFGPDGARIRSCPQCAEPIRAEAIKCKHCGSAVEAAAAVPG